MAKSAAKRQVAATLSRIAGIGTEHEDHLIDEYADLIIEDLLRNGFKVQGVYYDRTGHEFDEN